MYQPLALKSITIPGAQPHRRFHGEKRQKIAKDRDCLRIPQPPHHPDAQDGGIATLSASRRFSSGEEVAADLQLRFFQASHLLDQLLEARLSA
jgi:hypothetical protein